MSTTIKRSTLQFLRTLALNNNREWFSKNKNDYEEAKANVEEFVGGLIAKMNEHDHLETPSARKSLYRIYNDIRFSNDKTPYNPRFAGYLRRLKPALRGGYYYWIKPGGSSVGCGFTYPAPDDLRRIRQDIDQHYEHWKKLLGNRKIVSHFGQMQGEKVNTAPRGFKQDHPAIELLRYKQFWFERSFSDKEVLASDFLNQVNNTYKAIRPFFDHMSEVLNTNANGEPL